METNIVYTGNSFSIRRWATYFRLHLGSNKRRLLLGLFQILIITFLFVLLMFYSYGMNDYKMLYSDDELSNLDAFWDAEMALMLVLAFVFMAFSGSWTFTCMSNKKSRLSTIETPALQGEKFLVLLSMYLPLALLGIFCCFWIVDILRVIWIRLFTPYGGFAHILPFKNLVLFNPYAHAENYVFSANQKEITCITYSMLIFCNALFAMGSILFHKLSFLKTVIFSFVLMLIYAITLLLGKSVFSDLENFRGLGADWGFSISEYTISGVFIFLSISMYIFSYFRFKEEEIISRW